MGNRFGGRVPFRQWTMHLFVLINMCLIGCKQNKENLTEYLLDYDTIIVNTHTTALSSVKENASLNLPVKINASDNFQDYKISFKIARDTFVHIYSVGEAASYSTNPFLFKSYDNDGIEVYFDLNNEKTPFFDINKDDRQYRIIWRTLKIDGQNIETNNVKVYEKDPDSTTYTVFIEFPWKTLGYVIPKINTKVGFDVAIMDSDGGSMKALMNWHSISENSWRNTSYYGTLLLSGTTFAKADPNIAVATKVKSHSSPWHNAFNLIRNVPTYSISRVTIGSVSNSYDLSGKFQAQWDDKNLYVKIFVKDNIKTLANALFDFGWIEDDNHKIAWKMSIDNLKPAGGAEKNKYIDTTIMLKKGFYTLNYHTDESHCQGHWNDRPPTINFYGIKLAYQ